MSKEDIKTPQQYFDERMQLLGIDESINFIELWQNNLDVQPHKLELQKFPIFSAGNTGIDILCYTLDRNKITFAKEGSRYKINDYKITRLVDPIVKKDGSVMKYNMPKGVPVVPFFPPQLLAKFDAKKDVETLVLTEGYFKAFKAAICGIDCVGLPSITCLKDKETGELHTDIKKLIEVCKVQRIIWLTDGDCLNITTKDLKDGVDLYNRPNSFFKSVVSFYDLTSKMDNVLRYFAHIQTDNLDKKPKGLDDLLIDYNDDSKIIVKELTSFNKKKDVGNYFVKMEVSYGVSHVRTYFNLHDVNAFYNYHVAIRNELKDIDFRFNGTLYKYDSDKCECIIRIPKNAADYFRVGDDYHEFIEIPDKYNNLTRTYHRRRKETIKEDNIKDIFKYIPKYKAFCNVPDHINYQRVISNCFNTYHPFAHEPENGNCDATIDFIKHVFGEEEINIDATTTIKRYEIALDYLTLLYKNPQQILPILCLVSRERQTGKTTFLKWLKQIFTENCAIVGNQDFENNFNSHWASKLIIGCDETKIEKHVVMERIKGLSTASSIMKEGKGVDQIAMDFFGKFILLSNNEDNFASIDKEEIRFWIIKVPVIEKRNVDLLKDLLDEIPAFLHLLSQRKIITKNKERHWFDTKLLRTTALEKIVANSKPTLEKNICHNLTVLFERTNDVMDNDTIAMSLDDVVKYIAKVSDDKKNYVKQTLHNMGYKSQPFKRNINTPIVNEFRNGSKIDFEIISKPIAGRYYEFVKTDFLNDNEDIENLKDNLPF
ncbi:MAG: DUF5906 domain-containing protein [Bacteroidetes bacterium]|nr:DUF5906 domain-containing protein [Bacteroidota bacterium]